MCLLRVLTVVLGLVVLAVGYLFWTAPVVPLTSPPPPSLSTQAGPSDLRVTIAKRRLDQQMALSLKDNQNLQDPSTELQPPDRMKVGATFQIRLLGRYFSLRPSLDTRLGVSDGRVVVTPDRVQVGDTVLPAQLLQGPMEQVAGSMEDQINASVVQTENTTGLKLSAVSITGDTLILDFQQPS